MVESRVQLTRIEPGYASLRSWLNSVVTDRSRFLCLVPEQGILAREILQDKGAEIVEFGQLALQVSRILRMDHGMIASSRAIRAAIEFSTRQLPDDHPFNGSQRFPGFQRAFADTLRDLRHGGFEPDDLVELSWKLSTANPEMLRAVGETWIAVRSRLAEVHRQFATDLLHQHLSQELSHPDAVGDLVVVIPEREPLVGRWLQWLAHHNVPVQVAVEAIPGRDDVFQDACLVEKSLGCQANEQPGSRWSNHVFGGSAPTEGVPAMGEARIYDRLAEVEWCIREVYREMAEGLRPDQVGIYIREPEAYLPLLEHASKYYDLPLELTIRVPVIQNAFCRFVLEALEIFDGTDIRKLQSLFRSSYLGLSADIRLRLNEVILSSVQQSGSNWDRLRANVNELGEGFEWVTALLAWREESFARTRPLAEWLDHLRGLLETEPIPTQALSALNPTFERDARAANAMQRALTDLASIEGQANSLPYGSFVARCRVEWNEVEVTLPRTREGGAKVVTSVGQLQDFSALFVLEAAEGTLPRRRREDPILRDDARQALNEAFPLCGPMALSREVASRERDNFIRLCAAGQKRIQFTLPMTRDEQDVAASFYLDDLARLSGSRYTKLEIGSRHVLPTLEECRMPRDADLRQALDTRRLENAPPTKLQEESARAAVRPDFNEGISARQVSLAYECGFRAGWDRLQARPSRTQEALSVLSRLPLRASIARQPTLEAASAALDAEIKRFLAEKFAELPFAEWRRVEASAWRAARAWMESERKIRTAFEVEPEAVLMTVKLGEHGTRAGMKTDGGTLKFTDDIPVLMRSGNYTILRDYRRSIPDLAVGDMSDHLQWGLRLAMIGKGSKALLIETPEGKISVRTMREESDPALRMASTPGAPHRISSASIAETTNSQYLRELIQAAEIAVKRLESGDMEARPGAYCDRCLCGEACRVSAALVDDWSTKEPG